MEVDGETSAGSEQLCLPWRGGATQVSSEERRRLQEDVGRPAARTSPEGTAGLAFGRARERLSIGGFQDKWALGFTVTACRQA